MLKLLFYTILSCSLVCAFHSSEAQDREKSTLWLYERISLDFVPDRAFMIIYNDNSLAFRYEALLVPGESETSTETTDQIWFIGSEISIASNLTEFKYATLVHGENGRYAFSPPTAMSVSKLSLMQDPSTIRSSIKSGRETLFKVKKEVSSCAEELRRLRADADTIAGFDRVRKVQERRLEVLRHIDDLKDDIESLRKNIDMVKDYPAPPNYLMRERELTSQLTELAEAAKEVESRELARKADNENELAMQLRLIEETRFYDSSELEKELSKLQEERRRLEAESGVKTGSSPSDNLSGSEELKTVVN